MGCCEVLVRGDCALFQVPISKVWEMCFSIILMLCLCAVQEVAGES